MNKLDAILTFTITWVTLLGLLIHFMPRVVVAWIETGKWYDPDR